MKSNFIAIKQTRIVAQALEESKSHRDFLASPRLKQTTDIPLTRPVTPGMLNKIMEGKSI